LECWNAEPIKRPSIHEVVVRLRKLIPNSHIIIPQHNEISNQTNSKLNENLTSVSTEYSLHGDLSQVIQSFNSMNTNEIDMMTIN
jgi:hypothetical protein